MTFAVVPVVNDIPAQGFGDFLELTHQGDPRLKGTVYDIYRTGVKPIALTSDKSIIHSASIPITIVFDRMVQLYIEEPQQYGWGRSPLCPISRGSRMAREFAEKKLEFQQNGFPEEEVFQLAAMRHNPEKPAELQIGLDFKVVAELYRKIQDESRTSGESEIRTQKNLEHASPRLINISQFCFLYDQGALFLVAPIRLTSKGAVLATPSFFKEECSPKVITKTFLDELLVAHNQISPEDFAAYLSERVLPQESLLRPTTLGGISMMMGQDDRGGFKLAQLMELTSRSDIPTLQENLFQSTQSNKFDVLGLFKVAPDGGLPMKAEVIVRKGAQLDFNPQTDTIFISRTLDAFMMCLSAALSL